jgi:hypothetical protein
MGNFLASKLFVGLASFLGGIATTVVAKKTYDVVTQPKPIVFDAVALSKLSADAQRQIKDSARDAGLQA